MLTDRERLARRRNKPLLVELHHALGRLTSTLTVMNTGAHPDDEQSGLLAALRFKYGMRVVIACSTRGEGGQNSLGPERGLALGIIRTREMEEAARGLDADIAWLGFGPDDPVHDFGFSKSGTDTLARWGRERLLERLVRAYRRERPDVVIPTFLDVPGQHGHHRAMTEAAEAAIALAADPAAFPEHAIEGLAPWQVAKYYLPAWPGGGGTYDDEVPPPEPTLRVDASGRETATGASYAEIGEWSRSAHATQGMGRWLTIPQASWALHLKSGNGAAEQHIGEGLPGTLGELGTLLGGEAGQALADAQAAIDAALSAFPRRPAVEGALLAAATALDRAETAMSEGQRQAHLHRLVRKRRELDAALLLAVGVSATAWLDGEVLAPGERTILSVQLDGGASVSARPVHGQSFEVLPSKSGGDGITRFDVRVGGTSAPSTPFGETWSSLGGNGPLGIELDVEIGDHTARASLDLDTEAAIVPAQLVSDVEPLLLRLPASSQPHDIALRSESGGLPGLTQHPAFEIDETAGGVRLLSTPNLAPGRYRLPVLVDGQPASRQQAIAYPHIGRTRAIAPAALDLLAVDLQVPATRVGYVGGGADNVGAWLRRMGATVAELDAEALAGDLSTYNTIVIGVFAFGLREDLAAATSALHRWVRAGGHLVTLYHRPSDGWNPDRTPPTRLVIGSPSLRWRVTDPNAPVTILAPDHKLLAGPNRISDDDWAGWDKERGLYFASSWDAAYLPLLSLNDRGETPLTGALLSAPIGSGRHTHTSLVLHHQMDKLVPGAFRLMANLLQGA